MGRLAQGCTIYSRHLSEDGAVSPTGPPVHAPSLGALNFLAQEQLAHVSDELVDCGWEACALCSKIPQRVFVLADSLSAISAIAALSRFVKPEWDALDWCYDRQTQSHPAFNPHCEVQSIRSLRRTSSKTCRSPPASRQWLVRPEIPPLSLAPAGRAKVSSSDSGGGCTALMKQSSSAGQLERCRYRRRSASSPLGSDVVVLKKSALSRSGVLCLGNTTL